MAFLKRREILISEDRTLDLESGTVHEFNEHAPGLWLCPNHLEHCCVYRVPIRRVNPEAYNPQLLIIGPLHHSLKAQALKYQKDITKEKSMGYLNMEQHKKFYLAAFARRLEDEQIIEELREIIEESEEMIRASYSESTTWIESPEFVNMILHDSVFIIEFFLRTNGRRPKKTGDRLVDEPCLENTVMEDLILLENQLPYFILEKLFDPIFPTLRKLVITRLAFRGKIRESSKFTHFTDLVRLAYAETLPEHARGIYRPIEHMYTADKLDSRGVDFEAVEEEFSLNVSFENGCLKMPCFTVEDNVELVLRNVMALEQCHHPYNAHVSNYIMFLDNLIDTPKDVELLVEKGIIKNNIGEDGLVAEMVNKLGLGIVDAGSYYSDVAGKVNAHYENRINRLRAILKRVYFPNPWKGTATVAATLLLLMTLTQTVTSIIQTTKQ